MQERTNDMLDFLEERYNNRFSRTDASFENAYKEYTMIEPFAPNANVNDKQKISEEAHFIMRTQTQYHLEQAFNAMRIDLTDNNVREDITSGNIGTPGRIAKVWCGYDTHDEDELGGGRWSKRPRIASFPNTSSKKIPVSKRIDLISNCSHHFIPFTSNQNKNSYALISYIPDEFELGISKLPRVVNWLAQRFWLQEDLTKAIYDEIVDVAETESVYVGLFNIVHGCESNRGVKSKDGSFTTEYYGGDFESDKLRNQIKG